VIGISLSYGAAMDRAQASRIAHGDLRLWNPIGEAALDETIRLLDLPPGARVLDVACGRGEVLRRVAARFDISGIGYDRDPALLGPAQPGIEFEVRDSPPAGPFDLVVCIASSHAVGGFPEALGALCELVEPGGQVLLGEGFWRRPPSAAYLAALGAAGPEELPDYPGLMEAATQAGLTPIHACVAGDADWDRYEWRLILNAERWAADHPAEPRAEPVRERARGARERVTMPAGRDTLGFALVLLRRD
jgi:SAM-dependent methyltransferase